MSYNKVFVAGGAKGVGRAVIDKLVQQGTEVVALVRREDAKRDIDAIEGAWPIHLTAFSRVCGRGTAQRVQGALPFYMPTLAVAVR